MIRLRKKLNPVYLVVTVVIAFMMSIMGTVSVFAVDSSTEAQAQRELTGYVQAQLSQKDYAAEGGGFIKGSELFTGSATEGYDLNESQFNKLNSSAQTELVKDIASKSYEAEEKQDNVSEETVQNWWKQLQTKSGAGSKFMNVILENTKPDFVRANQIYAPFSGIVGTTMGIIAVVGMS